MKLDLKKWNEKRRPIEQQIRQLKDLISTPGRGGTWREYFDLGKLQDNATILYMARAEQRNKLHALVRTRYIFNPEMMRGGGLTLGSARAEELGIPQNIKVIEPVTREEQQKAIKDHPLLADLYKPEVQVIVGTDPVFQVLAEDNTQKILSAYQMTKEELAAEPNGAGTLLTTIYENPEDKAAAEEHYRQVQLKNEGMVEAFKKDPQAI